MKANIYMNLLSNNRNIKQVLANLLTLLIVLLIPLPSTGQPQFSPPINQPIELMDNNSSMKGKATDPHGSSQKFKQYVKDKYHEGIIDAESTVKHTLHGLSGTVSLSGDIVPKKINEIDLTKENDRHMRARAIAKAFMDDEPDLLGINNPDEIQESNISTTKGFGGNYTHVYYRRYINGVELENADMRITIGPTENITSVHARLKPASPEVYEATKKKTLTEEDIRAIIELDLKENQIDLKGHPITFKKMAILSEPYVVWKAESRWLYTMDAFTGNIISKFSLTKAGPNYSIKKDNQENTSPPMQIPSTALPNR